jgi:hypothetical protein
VHLPERRALKADSYVGVDAGIELAEHRPRPWALCRSCGFIRRRSCRDQISPEVASKAMVNMMPGLRSDAGFFAVQARVDPERQSWIWV